LALNFPTGCKFVTVTGHPELLAPEQYWYAMPLQFTYRASNRPSNLAELSIGRREIDWSSRINLRKPGPLTI
jgi:hypothetical protein